MGMIVIVPNIDWECRVLLLGMSYPVLVTVVSYLVEPYVYTTMKKKKKTFSHVIGFAQEFFSPFLQL